MSPFFRKRKGPDANAQLLTRAERELGKGNVKAALKDAKVAHRNEPTPESRKLVEAAYASRVEQLHRQNMVSEARAVLRELLNFQPNEPEIRARLPRLQVLVGETGVDTAAVFAEQPELLRELADNAILDPKCSCPDYADVPQQITAVRAALAAIEAGNDDQASTLLQEIPRTSPLSEWKLFLRGLTAFYQRDEERTTTNWKRLDPTRPPHMIAKSLQAAAGTLPPEDATNVAGRVKRLESQLGGGDGYAQVIALGEAWRTGEWRDLLAGLRRFRQRYGKTHDHTLQQMVELVWRRALREDNEQLFARLTSAAPAPAIDPKWNRVRALFAEHSRTGNATAVEDAWRAYARDIRELSCLSPDEREIAEGLVYLRLGRKFIQFAEFNASSMPNPWDDEEDDEEEDLRRPATKFFQQAIQVCPRLADAYRELAKLHEQMDDLDKAAAVNTKLLTCVPDDFDAQIWLASYHIERDEPQLAEAYIAAARRLKPRDPQCVALLWSQQLTNIRYLAKLRKFDEARAELKKMHEIRPPEVELFILDVLAAAIELKAKNLIVANESIDLAVSRLEEPTAIWLQMSMVAARYKLPRDIKKDFDQRFQQAIAMPPTSRTAGLLASCFLSLKLRQINYTGRATQERLALAYLRRATGISWEERDLATVCEWLNMLPRQAALFKRLSSLGVKQFPRSPRLWFFAGVYEMQRGPFACDLDFALECFKSVIEYNTKSTMPLSSAQLDQSREAISRLEEFLGIGQSIGFSSDFYDDDDDDDYDDDDDDDDDFDFHPGHMLPPGMDIADLIKSMPPSVFAAVKGAAAATGMTIQEVIEQAFGLDSPPAQKPKSVPKPPSRGRIPQSNQKNLEFDDE